MTKKAGVGLDVGTSYLVAARNNEGGIVYKKHRDAFIDLANDATTLTVLKNLGIDFIEADKKVLVVGDAALRLANTFRTEVRRPMDTGVISPKDPMARRVLIALVQSIVGEPETKDEVCVFTVPAPPLGQEDAFDTSYHRQVIEETLAGMGYRPIYANEALCLVYSTLHTNQFTGIGISFGAGMTNTCFASLGMTDDESQWSLPYGGDWIDRQVSNRFTKLRESAVTVKKEDPKTGINIAKDDGSEDDFKDAMAKFYRTLIENTIDNVLVQYTDIAQNLGEPIPIVIGGGTSLVPGFMKVFNSILESKTVDFEISTVIHADDPLYAVARGGLVRASFISKQE